MTYLVTTSVTLTVEADSEHMARAVAALTLNLDELPADALVVALDRAGGAA